MTGDRDVPASFITAIQAVIREAQYHGSSNTWSLPKDVLDALTRETSTLHGADVSPCRVLSISSRVCSKGTKGCEVFDHPVGERTMKEIPPNYERMAAGGWDGEAVPIVREVPRPHIIDGEFQSDKYPTCPRGKVPLSTKDKTAQPLLYLYAQIRRAVDAEFADDLEWALEKHGYVPDNDVMADAEALVALWEKKCKAPTPDTGGQIAMSRLAREDLVQILAAKLWGLHPLTTACLGTRPMDSASHDEVQPSEQPCGACGETEAPRGYFWGLRTACLDAKACTKRQKEKKT
jgi:hypothetical protein